MIFPQHWRKMFANVWRRYFSLGEKHHPKGEYQDKITRQSIVISNMFNRHPNLKISKLWQAWCHDVACDLSNVSFHRGPIFSAFFPLFSAVFSSFSHDCKQASKLGSKQARKEERKGGTRRYYLCVLPDPLRGMPFLFLLWCACCLVPGCPGAGVP